MAGSFGDICIVDPGMSDLSQNLLLTKSSLLGYSCQDLVSINGQVIFKKNIFIALSMSAHKCYGILLEVGELLGVSSSTTWIPGLKFRSSGLAPSHFDSLWNH